ncbi:hypothetical protein G6F43_008305 [Rhizopus delemar]|nr:hypothetical protein G6F43_008305 [Rhizopus delemar]
MKFAIAATALAFVSAASALSTNCGEEYIAKEGDTCSSIAADKKISIQSLYRLNVDNLNIGDCTALEAGKPYCVKAGSLGKRTWFYKTQGLTGKKLALAKKKAASFKKHSKKSSKKTTKKTTKKSSKKTTKKTTTKKSSSSKVTQSRPGDDWSSTPASAPSNAVRHIISTCNKYSTVTSSDSWCGDFAKRNGISTTQLYNWNAGLHRSGSHVCDNLDDGRAYCVGTSN